jgi:uncharacterized protein
MTEIIAKVAKLYIYPVKSMAGIEVQEAQVGIDGILGDRQYAFVQAEKAATSPFPWMTARESARMLAYQPELAEMPSPEKPTPAVRVRTPDGQLREASDPALLQELADMAVMPLLLMRSFRGMFDCQDLSVFNLATVKGLERETGCALDHRRFRANIYIEPTSPEPFAEEQWAGRSMCIGDEVIGGMTERDGRCVMINVDPQSLQQEPKVLKAVAQGHQGKAGIYVNVFRTGKIRVGDAIRWTEAEAGATG